MLFTESDEFTVSALRCQRLKTALHTAVCSGGKVIDVADLFWGVMCIRDERLERLWSRVMRRTKKRRSIDSVLREDNRRIDARAVRCRGEFSDSALEVLDTCFQILLANDDVLFDVGLELLVVCLIPRLSNNDRKTWSLLDLDRAVDNLQQRIADKYRDAIFAEGLIDGLLALASPSQPAPTASAPSQDDGASDIVIPEHIARCDDLTAKLESGSEQGDSPFAAAPQYEELFDDLARILHRGSDQHALLIGERGVGVESFLGEFTGRALRGSFTFLSEKRFILARCRHTLVEESRDRLLMLLASVASRKDAVVCIDGFGVLLQSIGGTTNTAALLSALPSITCRIIGIMSPVEYRDLIAGNADILEHFSPITLPEPDLETAHAMVPHFAKGLADRYGVCIEDEVCSLAVSLSANYILNDQLPAKAVRILKRVCQDIHYEREQQRSDRRAITADDVFHEISRVTGVPQETLRGIADKCDYERSLAEEIFGQEHVVKEIASELGLIKAGLTEFGKPASVMLFMGQTGTGKTEMAKALARFYSNTKRLHTYTLGNFVESHSVAGIIGVPPGYVGHDQGGKLINDLISDPYSVFLLDEADKSHPDVLQPFLNLFDEGWIRDQRGVTAHGDKAIFILTTNVGQRMIADMVKKGKGLEEITARMKDSLSQIKHGKSNRPVFTPEFLARIKRILVFQPLDEEAMLKICRKLASRLQHQWSEQRRKKLVIDTEVVSCVAREAHRRNDKSQGKDGGRVVRKVFADFVESAIQEAIMNNAAVYRDCTEVRVVGIRDGRAPDLDNMQAEADIEMRVRVVLA